MCGVCEAGGGGGGGCGSVKRGGVCLAGEERGGGGGGGGGCDGKGVCGECESVNIIMAAIRVYQLNWTNGEREVMKNVSCDSNNGNL